MGIGQRARKGPRLQAPGSEHPCPLHSSAFSGTRRSLGFSPLSAQVGEGFPSFLCHWLLDMSVLMPLNPLSLFYPPTSEPHCRSQPSMKHLGTYQGGTQTPALRLAPPSTAPHQFHMWYSAWVLSEIKFLGVCLSVPVHVH